MGAGSSSTNVTASTKAPNASCSFFHTHPAINKAFGSEKVLVWSFIDHLGNHEVRLEHDIFTGRRLIIADGKVVYTKARTLLDTGSTHQFTVGSIKCSVQIVEQGLEYGYALLLNEQTFARFRSEFWRYATLWYIPKNGKLETTTERRGSINQPNSSTLHTTPTAIQTRSSSPVITPTNSSSPPSAHSTSRYHTVIVLSHPQLTVLLNGSPVDLQSSFTSSMNEEETTGLPEHESTTHSFVAPRCEIEESIQPESQSTATSSSAVSISHGQHSTSSTGSIPCELTVWLDKNDPPLPPGHVSSHVPRDKRHSKYRYAFRMNGLIIAQAPSPLVSVHDSLHSSQNSSASDHPRHRPPIDRHRSASSVSSGGFGEMGMNNHGAQAATSSTSPPISGGDVDSPPLSALAGDPRSLPNLGSGSSGWSPDATIPAVSDFGMLQLHPPAQIPTSTANTTTIK